MMNHQRVKFAVLAIAISPVFLGSLAHAAVREWADATGNYKVATDLIARDDDSIVLRKEDGELVTLSISHLSKQDVKYLEGQDDQDATFRTAPQTFQLSRAASFAARSSTFMSTV